MAIQSVDKMFFAALTNASIVPTPMSLDELPISVEDIPAFAWSNALFCFFSNVPSKYDELPNDFHICWTSKITKNIHIKVNHNYIYHYMLAIFSHIFYMCSSFFHHLFLYSYRDHGWGGGHLLGLRQVRLIGSSWCALEPWSVNATCWRPRRRGSLGPATRWWVFFPTPSENSDGFL